jgi:RNA polymerase sigma factor (sigma-70 family)
LPTAIEALKWRLMAPPPNADVVATLVGSHDQFLAFLQKRVGDRALAEDILQDAYARSLPKLETLAHEESAVAWFYRILQNALIDHHRRHAAQGRKLAALASELEVEPATEARGTVCSCVSALATNLKQEYSTALQRVEVDGVAVKDYAQEAGISGSNAAVRLFRAREALRKQVKRRCGSCADDGCVDCTCQAASASCGGESP